MSNSRMPIVTVAMYLTQMTALFDVEPASRHVHVLGFYLELGASFSASPVCGMITQLCTEHPQDGKPGLAFLQDSPIKLSLNVIQRSPSLSVNFSLHLLIISRFLPDRNLW